MPGSSSLWRRGVTGGPLQHTDQEEASVPYLCLFPLGQVALSSLEMATEHYPGICALSDVSQRGLYGAELAAMEDRPLCVINR